MDREKPRTESGRTLLQYLQDVAVKEMTENDLKRILVSHFEKITDESGFLNALYASGATPQTSKDLVSPPSFQAPAFPYFIA